MAGKILFAFCFMYILTTVQSLTITEVSCGKTFETFIFMNDEIRCVKEDGSSNCENFGFFDIDKSQCFKCCNRFSIEPSSVLPEVKPTETIKTTEKLLTEKLLTEKPLTEKPLTVKPFSKEGLTKTEKIIIGFFICTAVAIGVLVVLLCRRQGKCGRRRHPQTNIQPHPQVDKKNICYTGVPGDPQKETIV